MQFLSQCCSVQRNHTTDAITYGDTVQYLKASGAVTSIQDQRVQQYPKETLSAAEALVVAEWAEAAEAGDGGAVASTTAPAAASSGRQRQRRTGRH